MAIEHLHLDDPVPINHGDSPYTLTDQLLVDRASDLRMLEPGTYTLTPQNTNYDLSQGDYRVEVSQDGRATCGQVLPTDRGKAFIHHPVLGELNQPALYLPDTATQICVIAMLKANAYRRTGIPHIFDVLRWKGDDDTLANLPGIAAVVNAESLRELAPYLRSVRLR